MLLSHETLLNITLQLINNKTAYTAQAAHTRARKALSLSKKKNITNRITKKNDTLSIDTCKRELTNRRHSNKIIVKHTTKMIKSKHCNMNTVGLTQQPKK